MYAQPQHRLTVEWLILNLHTKEWSSITFQKGNSSLATVVRHDGTTYQMGVQNALEVIAYTLRSDAYDVCEVI